MEDLLNAVAQAQQTVQRAEAVHLDAAINDALAVVGKAFGADRAYIFQTRDLVFIDNTHEWCAVGVTPFKAVLQQIPYHVGEAMWTAFETQGAMLLPDISLFPVGTELRHVLAEQGIKALISVPIREGNAITGFMGLDFCKTTRRFNASDQNLLQALAATLSLALQARGYQKINRRLEAELRAAKDRLAAMLREAPELLLELDSDGVIVAFHHNAAHGPGLDPTEIIGLPPEAVFPPHPARIIRDALMQARAAGASDTLRYTLQGGGQDKRFSVYATRRKGSARGGAAGYLVILRDVTQSHLQDQHIRQLVRVADLSTNLIFLMDAEGCVTWMNPAALCQSGMALTEARGKRPSDILGLTESDPDAARLICAALDQGEDVDHEVEARSKDGHSYWARLTLKKLCDAEQVIEAYMIVGVNVTRTKLAEARALQDRANAMDALNEGIALVQPDGRFIYMNPVLHAFLNLPEEALATTLSWHEVTPPEFNSLLTDAMPRLFAQGSWQGELDLPGDAAEGRAFEMSIAVQEDGNFLFIARDVTARKRAMREQTLLREHLQIAQSRQLVAQLAGGLAHDVANTLAVIGQVLETVRGAQDLRSGQALGRIEAAVGQAQALVRNLSHLGRRTAQPSLLDLRAKVAQAADLVRPGLDSRAQLSLELPESPVEIRADSTSVMQVLLNLMLNARDALCTGPGAAGQIMVRVTSEGPFEILPEVTLGHLMTGHAYAMLEVADTGEGMTPERMAAMFTPYFTTKGMDGIGLGLSIVADIVVTSLGAVQVETDPGRGTVLRVYWPSAGSNVAMRVLGGPPDHVPALSGRAILLVDDDDAILQQMAQALSAAGAEVASCICPEDALEALSADPEGWNLVVTDMEMGTMSGVDLACAMRKIRPDLPIVLVTGGDIGQNVAGGLGKEFAFVLRKPVSETALVAVILDTFLRRAS